MAPIRYEQFCPLARAAEILGERWTLLILRELACGPQRFSDLRRRLPGLSSSVLSERLAGLEERGLLARREAPPPAPATLYAFTEEGEAFRPVLRELMRFGARHLEPFRPGDHVEADWLPVAASAFARTDPVPRRVIAVQAHHAGVEVAFRVTGGGTGTQISHGAGPAELTIRASTLVILGLVTGQLDPADLLAAGQLEAEGDLDALRDLPALFDLREIIARPATG